MITRALKRYTTDFYPRFFKFKISNTMAKTAVDGIKAEKKKGLVPVGSFIVDEVFPDSYKLTRNQLFKQRANACGTSTEYEKKRAIYYFNRHTRGSQISFVTLILIATFYCYQSLNGNGSFMLDAWLTMALYVNSAMYMLYKYFAFVNKNYRRFPFLAFIFYSIKKPIPTLLPFDSFDNIIEINEGMTQARKVFHKGE